MTAKTRISKLQRTIVADAEGDIDRLKSAFMATVDADELRAYWAVYIWLAGYSHGRRPTPATMAKAFAVRERMPHDLIEAFRKWAKASGQMPNAEGEVT